MQIRMDEILVNARTTEQSFYSHLPYQIDKKISRQEEQITQL